MTRPHSRDAKMSEIWAELPQDLFWPIIDLLDTASLCQASLVCRAWMSYASGRLLRRVVVNRTSQCDSHATPHGHRPMWYDYTIFHDLVARSERLRRHVRELRIEFSWEGLPSAVLCMCRRLPQLEVLHLEGGLPVLHIEERTAFGGTLKLSWQGIGSLVGILSVFTSILHLCVMHTPENDRRGDAVSKAQRSGSRIYGIEEITLREVKSDTLAVLQAFVEPTTLKKVTLLGERSWTWYRDGESFLASFNVFLETTCKNITHLSLNTGYLDRRGSALTALRSLVRLETLELEFPSKVGSVFKSFDKVLAHAPETLRHLHLRLEPIDFEVFFEPSPIAHFPQLMGTLRSVQFTLLVQLPASRGMVCTWRNRVKPALPAHLRGRHTLTVGYDASNTNIC